MVILGAFIIGELFYIIIPGGDEDEVMIAPTQEVTTPEPEPDLDIINVVLEPPTPFIIPDFAQEIGVSSFSADVLRSVLNDLASNTYPANSITYIPIRLSSPEESQYLDAQQFFSQLEITRPENFNNVLDTGIMLFMYGSGEEEQGTCQANSITTVSCFGPRLGIALKAQSGLQGALPALVERWKQLIDANMASLILSEVASPNDPIVFNAAQFQPPNNQPSITVSYANMPISTMSVNFAVVQDLIVIGTSKNTSYAALNRIFGQ